MMHVFKNFSREQKKKSNNVLPGLQPNLRLTVIALNFDAGTLALITMEGRHNLSQYVNVSTALNTDGGPAQLLTAPFTPLLLLLIITADETPLKLSVAARERKVGVTMRNAPPHGPASLGRLALLNCFSLCLALRCCK